MKEEVKKHLDQINGIDERIKRKISFNEWEASEIIGVSDSSLANYRKQGIGPEYRKIGGRYIYSKIALAEFMADTIKTA